MNQSIIDPMFTEIARLKYPDDQPCAGLQTACKCDLYASFVRAVEIELPEFTHRFEAIAEEAAATLLAGAGGTKWTRDAAEAAVQSVVVGIRVDSKEAAVF